MSNIERFENIAQLVKTVEPEFTQLAKIHGAVQFAREASFALQILKNNPYLAEAAAANQDSLKRAILNVAAIGLSLSPVHKLAYLVPRKKAVCLDISYRGFVHLATDIGAIKWAVAAIVCKADTFELTGFGKEPIHKFNPFDENRGEVVGAYCVAKTHDADFLTTVMSAEEIISIRDRSESFKSTSSPWVTDRNEMIKKTVIRRAYKLWPMTDTRKRFDQAIDVTSEVDPIDFTPQIEGPTDAKVESLKTIRDLLQGLDRTEEKYVEHLSRTCRREIKKLEELTANEIARETVFLNSLKPKSAKELA